jgi:hypothetical protein
MELRERIVVLWNGGALNPVWDVEKTTIKSGNEEG